MNWVMLPLTTVVINYVRFGPTAHRQPIGALINVLVLAEINPKLKKSSKRATNKPSSSERWM